jgi:hypothetical protein
MITMLRNDVTGINSFLKTYHAALSNPEPKEAASFWWSLTHQ